MQLQSFCKIFKFELTLESYLRGHTQIIFLEYETLSKLGIIIFITLTCHILTELGRLELAHYISSHFYKCSSRSKHAARHKIENGTEIWPEPTGNYRVSS